MKYLNLVSLLLATIVIGGCVPQSDYDNLKEELEELKNPTENVNPKPPTTQQPTVIYTPAPTPPAPAPAPSPVKFGPGSGNNMMTATSGLLSIHTNSANGKLTLRSNPAQNAAGLIEIPNGTSGISYFSRIQVGEYVWYEATYGSYTGYLRGDYVDPY
jgi:hypothetical protein